MTTQDENKKDMADVEVLETARDTKKTLSRLGDLLCQQKLSLIILGLATIGSTGLFVMTPLIVGKVIDALIHGFTTKGYGGGFVALHEMIGEWVLLFIIVYTVSSLCTFVQEYTIASIGERLVLPLRRQISEKITKLPLRYFDSHPTGDILSKTINDLNRVSEVLKTGLLQFADALLGITISVLIMLSQSVSLTLIVLGTLGISVFATKWIATKNFQIATKNQAILGEMSSYVEEAYTGNLIIKSFNGQQMALEQMREISARQYTINKYSQFALFAVYPTMRFLTQFSFVVTAVAGGAFAVQGMITIGTVQAFLQYVEQMGHPITQTSYFINSMQGALASAERVFDFLDEEEEIPDTVRSTALVAPQGAVRFENVRFGYTPDNILMENVSFDVQPNEMVAIVGPTGAGKTTLINLLMRFYEVLGGKIVLDGVNITDMSKTELRSHIGMVLQDTWLFQGTIAENIAYGNRTATREDIIRVAQAVHCDHFIRTLENGYDTVLSSEMGGISLGQMQLLTIARAMLANPVIMVLDEATSSVDTRTEIEVQRAMSEIMKGKTSFVIAHRLSTIQSADLILVMKDGTIIEKGTHESLLREKTFYRELYNSQFSEG